MDTPTTLSFDVEKIRGDFPILNSTMRGKPLVYLDSAATALKPAVVIEAVSDYYRSYTANPHRGVYEMSERASVAYEAARAAVRAFFDVPDDYSVIFTSGSTDSLNFIASGFTPFLGKRKQIVLSLLEHHANIVPWQVLSQAQGLKLCYLPLTEEDEISLEDVDATLDSTTALLAITGMSNVTGYRPPLRDICRIASDRGVLSVVDGAQLASHGLVSIHDLGCDFFVCSAHKLYGPTGLGCLIAKTEYLEQMNPFRYGGGMIADVEKETTTFASIPERFEGGSPHVAGAIGFHAALSYLDGISMDAAEAHEAELLHSLRSRLSSLPYVKILGGQSVDRTSAVCSFLVDGVHSHDVGTALDSQGVAIRIGHHCAQLLIKSFCTTGAARVSLGLYNTMQEVEIFLDALEKTYHLFR